MTNNLQNSQEQVAVEMWRYNPRKLSTRNVVDELSLALALREDADERVGEAVEEMLNELWMNQDSGSPRSLCRYSRVCPADEK